ncbi:MAG: ATP-dependent sacrificial sulfur transferase LarE, partial [Gemmatimonadota bacterium]
MSTEYVSVMKGDHSMELVAATRERQLLDWFEQAGSVLIGFSGGVDSSYVAATALAALPRHSVLGVIGTSASYPEVQWKRARAVAGDLGLPLLEVPTDELANSQYAANPVNRCYYCKSELWSRLVPIACERGLAVVVDGTNADDATGHRPGRKAAVEYDVRSPLAEIGLSKEEIRHLSRLRGLATSDLPSSPCLASRIPYATAVTSDRLQRIGSAEDALRAIGVTGDLRVRYHGDTARVELEAGT